VTLGEAPRVNFQMTKVNPATNTRAAAARRMVLDDLVIVFMCVISFDIWTSHLPSLRIGGGIRNAHKL
jgi:hypothetical protein